MILWDRVDILDANNDNAVLAADVPAHVYGAESLSVTEQFATYVDTKVRAMLPPDVGFPLTTDAHRIGWRGGVYQIDGEPIHRRRRGRDHHQTVSLNKINQH